MTEIPMTNWDEMCNVCHVVRRNKGEPWCSAAHLPHLIELSKTECGHKVGSKPWWMGEDQYDPCTCILKVGHDGGCRCSHTIDNDSGATAPGE